jgi:NAD(P)-dependent dehydrogenase (short-subunit alcohol dehydrogenase family)
MPGRTGKHVAVVVGATSKWQSDGRNTLLAHGKTIDDSDMPVGGRWGIGGAIAQKFAQEGFFVVLTTRKQPNATPLAEAIREQNGQCMIVELDLVSLDSISPAFATIRREAGGPEVLSITPDTSKASLSFLTRSCSRAFR